MGFSIVEYLRREEQRKQMSVSSYSGASQTPVGYGRGSGGFGVPDYGRRNYDALSNPLTRARDFVMDVFAAEHTAQGYVGRLNKRFSLGV